MQVAARLVRKCLEKFLHQADAKIAHHRVLVIDLVNKGGAIREIEGDPREGFIHR